MSETNQISKLDGLSDKQKVLLALRLKKQHATEAVPSILPFDRQSNMPATISYSQKRFWFLDQFNSNKATNHLHLVTRLEGELNHDAIRYTFSQIMKRHEILRMVYQCIDGEVYCVPAPSDELPLRFLTTEENNDLALHHQIHDIICEPFDLAKEVPIRITILSVPNHKVHFLIVLMHHIASDMWSLRLLNNEIEAFYNSFITAQTPNLTPLTVQYLDYAKWQHERLETKTDDAIYWKETLSGMSPRLQLFTDFKRPDIQTYNGAMYKFPIPPKLFKQISEAATHASVTPFVYTLAAYGILLSKYTRNEDFAIGSPIAGRINKQVEPLIGLFINTLVLRMDLSKHPTVNVLLGQLKKIVAGAMIHQEYPFERLLKDLNVTQNLSYTPIFQVMFNYQSIKKNVLQLEGLKSTSILPTNSTAKFDLNLAVKYMGDQIFGEMTYNTDLFHQDTIISMCHHYLHILEQMTTNPSLCIDDIVLTNHEEAHQLLALGKGEALEYQDIPYFHLLFEKQVNLHPNQIACVFEENSYTYSQLNEKANQLARYLIQMGVQPESHVGLFISRNLNLIVGLLGIIKAGAAYVPIDPIYPDERIAYIFKDAAISLVVTETELMPKLTNFKHVNPIILNDSDLLSKLSTFDSQNLTLPLKSNNLFYILYTSGSTGNPKGVAVEHGNYIHYYFGIMKRLQLEPGLKYAIASTFAADLATINVWGALNTGGTLHILSYELSVSPTLYAEYFKKHQIDVIKMVPSHFRSLAEKANLRDIIPNHTLILAGEASYLDMIRAIKLAKPSTNIQIHYGPTETTVSMLTYKVTDEFPIQYTTTMPLGRPIPNVSVYILDEFKHLVPIGVPGELYIAGPGVTRGYVNQEDLTAERFIENPFSSKHPILYRTGDLVRYLFSGDIEFLGRTDDQVKIKGFRIELGEITSAILEIPGIHTAYVTTYDTPSQDKLLICYYVKAPDCTLSADDLTSYLRDMLPHYMIPNNFTELDELPLNANGKINKFALPEPNLTALTTQTVYEPPHTEEEKQIVKLFEKILGIEQVGINDHFFNLGGDSFKAVEFIRHFNGAISIMDIFKYSTPKELGHLLTHHQTTQRDLLYQISNTPDAPDHTAIICIPFAGGSAIAYKELGEAVPHNITIYAVQIPGHDFSQPNEALEPLKVVALKVVEEIKAKVKAQSLAVYGHCLGGALGIEIARLLTLENLNLVGVFMGGNFPVAELPGKFFKFWNRLFPRDKRMSNRAYMDMLRSLGGFNTELSDDERDFIINSLRHDRRESERYFSEVYANEKHTPLDVPLLCIVGENDRTTEFYMEQYHDWEYFCPQTDIIVIPNSGHYFFKHQAHTVSDLITERLDKWKEERHTPNPTLKLVSTSKPPSVLPSLKSLGLFVTGQLVSSIGSSLMSFALGVWMLLQTGATMDFAATLIFNRLPGILVLPISGTIADKFDRKKILILSNLGSALVTLWLTFLFFNNHLSASSIYLGVSILSITAAFQRPAYLAAVAQITPKRYLGQANGFVQLATSMSELIAPTLSAFLLGIWDLQGIIFINFISFIICILTLCIVKIPDTLFRRNEETFREEMVGGWKFIIKRPSFVALVIYFAVANLMLGMANVLVTPLVSTLGSTLVLGIVSSVTGLGGLIGGITMSLWGGTTRRSEGMLFFDMLIGLAYVIMGIRPSVILVTIGIFIYGISMSLVNAHWQTLIQSKVRAELLARVFSINQLFVLPTIPLGYYFGGLLSDHIFKPLYSHHPELIDTIGWLIGTGDERGIALLFIILGIMIMAWGFICFHWKPLRFMDDILPDAVPGPMFIKDINALQEEEDQKQFSVS